MPAPVAPSDLVIPASPGSQHVLSNAQVASIRAWLGRVMVGRVRVQVFVDGAGCDSCEVTSRVLQQLQTASDKLQVSVQLASQARKEGEPFERLPETRVVMNNGNAVRFFGTQVGVEVTSLVQTIADASLPSAPLPPDAVKGARTLPPGSWLRVFVGPACTHCPGAVRAAVALAHANPKLAVEVVSTSEFPELAHAFKVAAVPTTVVNGRAYFEDPRSPLDVLEALYAAPPEGAQGALRGA